MKQLISTLLISILTIGAYAQTGTFHVDTRRSTVNWHAEKVTGEHDGTVALKKGNIEFKDGKLIGGNFEIDMTTIANTDIEDPDTKKKLVNHLKSDDFFSVGKHPSAKLEITEVLDQGNDEYKVAAKMTIKGITKNIKFTANVSSKKGLISGKADITIDRTQFDVRYGSGTFFENLGDKTIYDEFELAVNISARAK